MPGSAVSLRAPLAVAAAGAALAAALLARDPHSRSWGACPVLLLTGVPCPGCGGLRAAHDLLTGRLAEAVSSNLYAVATAAAAGLALVWWLVAAARGGRPRWQPRLPALLTGWAGGLLLFGVARLLPGLEWLQP